MSFTTIAIKDSDKERLDEAAETLMEDPQASYREIINYLIDEVEHHSDDYEEVLARVIANSDEDDVTRAIRRVESDKRFVEALNEEE